MDIISPTMSPFLDNACLLHCIFGIHQEETAMYNRVSEIAEPITIHSITVLCFLSWKFVALRFLISTKLIYRQTDFNVMK